MERSRKQLGRRYCNSYDQSVNASLIHKLFDSGLKLLMDSGAEVDLKDKHDQTALHVAVEEKVPKEALQTLVERSGNVNATDNNHKTPLHLLARNISVL